jgi:hypothetical protein
MRSAAEDVAQKIRNIEGIHTPIAVYIPCLQWIGSRSAQEDVNNQKLHVIDIEFAVTIDIPAFGRSYDDRMCVSQAPGAGRNVTVYREADSKQGK